MTGKTHQVIGLTAGLAVYTMVAPSGYAPATVGAVLVASHLAALLPDIDQPAASIWQSVPFGRVVGELVDPFLAHRNLSHSLLGFGVFAYLLSYLVGLAPLAWGWEGEVVFAAGCAAYGSHLLADMITVQGIPLLFPIQRSFGIPPKPFNGLRIVTGRWFENGILFPLANLALLLLVWQAWPRLQGALIP